MIRILLVIGYILWHFVGVAQVKEPDSLDYGDITITPIEYPPTMLNCEGLENGKQRSCMNAEIVKLIRNNLALPLGFDSIDTIVRVYVSFIVDTTAQVSDIEISLGADRYFSETQSDLIKKLNSEAIRVVGLFKYTEPGHMLGKAVRQKMTVPVTFSNPEKEKTTEE